MLKYLELGVYGTDLKPSHPFIGSAIRGTFGYALRKASCPFVSANCEKCDISGECVYREFFGNVSDTPNFRLLRVAFIVSLSKSSKKYEEKILKEYETYFNKIQNAMSLPSKPTRIALLKASPKVAIYFKEGMKLFFPTQKFKKRLDDGSIIFSIDFTQDMEILPFIKKWLPDIEILEPKDLRETFKEQLKAALDILSE